MTKMLPDINVWIALIFDSHIHHAVAKQWFDCLEDGDQLFFCRLTQQGFLRISNNTKAMKTSVLSMTQAWAVYDQILADSRIYLLDEPRGIEQKWRKLTSRQTPATNVWSDAWLAAFAISHKLELVTFDHGFTGYRELPIVILGDETPSGAR